MLFEKIEKLPNNIFTKTKANNSIYFTNTIFKFKLQTLSTQIYHNNDFYDNK